MSKWWHISMNTELLLMTAIGLAATTMEGIYMNLRENIKEVWLLKFPEEIFSSALENLVKSILCGIIIAKGATVHASLAAHLLIIYPLITEKLRIMLVVWLVIAAIRTFLINMLATVTGCVLCATYPEIRPVCFEFVITKAIELACSVYMWVNVNDFYHLLKDKLRHMSSQEKVEIPGVSKNIDTQKKENAYSNDSFDSYSLSLSKSFLDKLNDKDVDKDSVCFNSFIAKTALHWFMIKSSSNHKTNQPLTMDKKLAETFLSMSIDEIIKLQRKIKELNERNHCLNMESVNDCQVDDKELKTVVIKQIIDNLLEIVLNLMKNSKGVQVELLPGNTLIDIENRQKLPGYKEVQQLRQNLRAATKQGLTVDNLKNAKKLCELFQRNTVYSNIDQTVVVRALYEKKTENLSKSQKP